MFPVSVIHALLDLLGLEWASKREEQQCHQICEYRHGQVAQVSVHSWLIEFSVIQSKSRYYELLCNTLSISWDVIIW